MAAEGSHSQYCVQPACSSLHVPLLHVRVTFVTLVGKKTRWTKTSRSWQPCAWATVNKTCLDQNAFPGSERGKFCAVLFPVGGTECPATLCLSSTRHSGILAYEEGSLATATKLTNKNHSKCGNSGDIDFSGGSEEKMQNFS